MCSIIPATKTFSPSDIASTSTSMALFKNLSINTGLFPETLTASSIYAFSVFMGWDPAGRIAAIGGAIGGLIVVVALAALLNPPIWFYLGGLAALLTGTLAMGTVSTSMVWGHWYLTEGSLPPRPLRELTLILISVIGLQTIFFIIIIFLQKYVLN